jgi:hypothetical protein
MFDPDERTVSQFEAAAYVGLPWPAFVELRRQGRGPRFFRLSQKPNSKYRYTIQELDRWLKGGFDEPTRQRGADQHRADERRAEAS